MRWKVWVRVCGGDFTTMYGGGYQWYFSVHNWLGEGK